MNPNGYILLSDALILLLQHLQYSMTLTCLLIVRIFLQIRIRDHILSISCNLRDWHKVDQQKKWFKLMN